MTGRERAVPGHRPTRPPSTLSGRERSIFACLTDVLVAPGDGLPEVRDTDAVAAMEAQLRVAPAPVRAGIRAALLLFELAPRALGCGGRLRQLTPAGRAEAVRRLDRHPATAGVGKALRGLAHISYYGDDAVMRRLGYDADAVVARGAVLRAAEARSVSPARDTGAAAYLDGRGTFHPDERRIVRGADLGEDTTIEVDVCVIGSGAGGAPVAKELAEGGLRVAVLEEGHWHEASSFTARPRDMTPRLYRDGGTLTTIGTPPIVLPLGRAVGGTTLINSGTCFRTPPRVLEVWRRDFGLDLQLDPFFARVERIVNVAQVPESIAGNNALVVKRGADTLGVSGDFLFRNAKGCVGSGVCAFGCPTGAKQHTGITYVPRAWAAGATTYTGVTAQRVVVRGGAVRAVQARTSAGGRVTVRCTHAVVAAGTLLTPGLLRRSGVRHPQLGKNLAIHPASAARAVFEEDLDPWAGVPQSYYVDELAADGVMLEGIAGPPDQAALSTPRSGAAHRELMLDARRTATFGVMVSDTARGSVRQLGAHTIVRYDLHPQDAERFRRGFELLADIFFAAGAREVLVPLGGLPGLRDGDTTPLREHRTRPGHVSAMAFHPLGTARAGADPERSVVDEHLKVHGVDGLHVADGSVVPSSLGVNPQITIMALATRLAYDLLGRPAPRDEPTPSKIA